MSRLHQRVVDGSLSDSVNEVNDYQGVGDAWIIEASDVCCLAGLLQLQIQQTPHIKSVTAC